MGANNTELIETGDKRDGRGHTLRVETERADYVRAYQRSGLTMAAFARQEGLKYSTFAGWVLRQAKPAPQSTPVRFAEVGLPTPALRVPAAGLEVCLVDGTVLRGTNVPELAALVRAVRS
jgi:transposase-like protein